MFRIILPSLLLALQAYLLVRFWRWSKQHAAGRRFRLPVVLAFLLFNGGLVALMLTRLRTIVFPDWFIYTGVYPFFVWHSATFLIGLFLASVALLKLPFRGIWEGLKRLPATRPAIETLKARPAVQRFDASRRTFLRRGVYGLTAASFGGTAYGMLVEKSSCDINEAVFAIPGLPQEFSGYTIGLVTDVHSSLYMREKEMTSYTRLLNDLGADMIVMGGDLVNGRPEEILPFASAFSGLRAPDGVFGVLGNHDFYSGDPDRIAEVATEAGVRILRNQGVVLRRGDAAVTLLGVDDTGRADAAAAALDRALASVRVEGPSILVNHRPYFLNVAARRNVDLMLSGHTHGGQVVFGSFADTVITPAALASPYVWGRYANGAAQMYVSRGIGTVGVPIRINCPPELTRIVLRPA